MNDLALEFESESSVFTYEQALDLVLTRNTIFRCCTVPGFGTIVSGCFIRVSVSRDTYRLLQIENIRQCEPYNVDGVQCSVEFVTTDAKDKVIPVKFVSNSQAYIKEYYTLIDAARARGDALPTKEDAIKKAQLLNAWVSANAKGKGTVTNNTGRNKTLTMIDLILKRDLALDAKETEAVERIEEQIKKLEEYEKHTETVHASTKPKQKTQSGGIRRLTQGKTYNPLDPCVRKKSNYRPDDGIFKDNSGK